MKYKGYVGRITDVDPKSGVLHGRVTNISDVVTFEATTAADADREFRVSVDCYLNWCAERGDKAETPYGGLLMARVSPRLHKQAALRARQAGVSLNDFVQAAITAALLAPEPSAKAKPLPAVARKKQAKA